MRSSKHRFTAVLAVLLVAASLAAQSGNKPNANAAGGVQVGIIARREDNKTNPITSKELSIYDNGIEQSIRNFTPDPSPARIVLLVDNSLSIRADVPSRTPAWSRCGRTSRDR